MTNPQPEPSMEEILASIRRIISEDEEEENASAPKPAASSPSPAKPASAPQKPALVLGPREQADRAEAEQTAETKEDQMTSKPALAQPQEDEEILAEPAAAAASKVFQSLSQSVRVSRGEGKTLEDIVTELLKPMLKDWLDNNLQQIVEEKVEEEVQRIARRRG